jgi:hypothetical protein
MLELQIMMLAKKLEGESAEKIKAECTEYLLDADDSIWDEITEKYKCRLGQTALVLSTLVIAAQE